MPQLFDRNTSNPETGSLLRLWIQESGILRDPSSDDVGLSQSEPRVGIQRSIAIIDDSLDRGLDRNAYLQMLRSAANSINYRAGIVVVSMSLHAFQTPLTGSRPGREDFVVYVSSGNLDQPPYDYRATIWTDRVNPALRRLDY